MRRISSFPREQSLASLVVKKPQLAVLRTLSKAHGLAGARLGTLIADPEIIALLRKLIAPYAIPQLILEAVLMVLSPTHVRGLRRRIRAIASERDRLQQALGALKAVTAVLPSEANFLLARFVDPAAALEPARAAQVLVRDTRGYPGLEDALRITVGTSAQHAQLLEAWE